MTDGFDRIAGASLEHGVGMTTRTTGQKILIGIEQGRGTPQDIELLRAHTRWLGPGRTFCAHAPGAMEPLQSALKYFGDEFTARVNAPKQATG